MLSSKTTPKDMKLIRNAVGESFACVQALPFEYKIDGILYHGIPEAFSPKSSFRLIDANIAETVYTGIVPGANLDIRVEILEYRDYPVYEWTVFFANHCTEDSGIISDFYGCKADFPLENVRVYHNNGDSCIREGLETSITELKANESLHIGTKNGRSCDGALPYFKVMGENCGYVLSVGWPGQWTADFTAKENGFEFAAKQQYTRFYLNPGETARSPRMTVMAFEGDDERGTNVWRRWFMAHVLPRSRGSALGPKVSLANNGGGEEFTCATEENQLYAINKLIERGVKPDIWWIDAGWYPCRDENGERHWVRTGDWSVDSERFPNGLKPVGDLCEKYSIQLLLWFETERIMLDCWPKDYPKDHILCLKEHTDDAFFKNTGLLDLGNNECREWITELIDKIIRESGVKVYRQDFNGVPFPLDWWLQNETEDRRGITENLHITGYLRMWDDLLMRNPDLWIDSCSSGGRRNDLEAMRRAVPLHPTDYGYGDHPVKQAFETAWFSWTPYFRGIALSWDDEDGNYNTGKPYAHGFDSYAAHCALAPVYTFGAQADSSDEEFQIALAFKKIWDKAAPYTLTGNFYLLTELRKSSEDYFSIQFYDEDDESGIIQVIRNTRCEKESVTVFPRQFEEGEVYLFESPEFNGSFEATGKEIIQNGFTVSIPKRSGEIWFYKVKK